MTGLTKLGGDTFRQAMTWTKQTENVESKSVAELPTRRSKHNRNSAQDIIEHDNDYTTSVFNRGWNLRQSKGMIDESDVNRHVMPLSTNTLSTHNSNIRQGSNENSATANTPTMQPVIQSGSTWKRKMGAGKFVQQVEDSTGSPNTGNMEHSRYETTQKEKPRKATSKEKPRQGSFDA